MERYFFAATKDAARQVTDIFDFVWPTSAALWNFRSLVGEFVKRNPEATVDHVHDHFSFGKSVHKIDLRRACVLHSWEKQQSGFAQFVLTNAFAVYETWAEEVLVEIGEKPEKSKKLQFYDLPRKDKEPPKPGLQAYVKSLCSSESATLKAAYYPALVADKKYAYAKVENLLRCYRYFKEGRNCLVHSGGKASKEAVEAYNGFHNYTKASDLGSGEDIGIEPYILNKPIRFTVRSAVALCDIVLRLMISVDAELSRSAKAEKSFEARLRVSARGRDVLSGDRSKRKGQISGICRSAQLAPPRDADAIYQFMKARRIIKV